MTLTIEPMIICRKKTSGNTQAQTTGFAKTKNGRLSDNTSHTLLVTADGVEVLKLVDQKKPRFS